MRCLTFARRAVSRPARLRGFISMLHVLRQQVKADYLACVFDAKGRTFRDDLYAEYKANRTAMPDDLARQIEPIHAAVRALGWPIVAVEGIEADDVIATLARRASEQQFQTMVSTSDKDLAQLVNEQVTLVNTMSNETLDVAGVESKIWGAARAHRRLSDAGRGPGRQRSWCRQGGAEDGGQVAARVWLARRR